MDKKEFYDKLAGRPWVRLRQLADLIDALPEQDSALRLEYEEEAVGILGHESGQKNLVVNATFLYPAQQWWDIADKFEEKDKQDKQA